MNDKNTKLQSLLQAMVGKGEVTSIVAAVQSIDKSIDFIGAAGIADLDSGTPMTADTPYFLASVSKMYTVTILMQLYEEKRLDLEAPISHYLPASMLDGIHVYKGTDYSGHIKVYQLINQTSGLADFEIERPKGGKSVLDALKAGQDSAIDTAEALRITRRLSPHFAPGTPGKAFYSNLNYRLLGEIIESVTQKPMAMVYQERICRRLDLQHTYLFDWQQLRSTDAPAVVYLKKRTFNVPKYISSNTADGGLVATAAEVMIFLRAFFEGRLFDKSLLTRMMTFNKMVFPLSYGYGLMYFRLPRYFSFSPLPYFIGHSGSTGSFAFLCPSHALYLVGTLNQICQAKPFFFMIKLIRSID